MTVAVFLFSLLAVSASAATVGECMALLGKAVDDPPASSRVALRPTGSADARRLGEMERDPLVSTYFVGVNDSFIEKIVARHIATTYRGSDGSAGLALGAYVGEELVGSMQLSYLPERRAAAIGYVIKPDRWNQGLATEAAGLLVRFAVDNLDVDYIYAVIHENNPASIAVVKKLGFSSKTKPVTGSPGYFYHLLYPKKSFLFHLIEALR